MIIGTAGHIDHGKTTLVQALTGVNTDRLPEEQRRGVSIELGYAFLDTPGGERLAFIDVPGHERLVHTMLSGATGIDYALLLVAADDGVMPQTREHLAVLSLLGLRHGAVVLTKIDRADAPRQTQVHADIQALVAGTFLEGAPVWPVSAVSGLGIEALRNHLASDRLLPPMNEDPVAGGFGAPEPGFRMAIDRAFTLAGVGTVVTGTVHGGTVQVGDSLVVCPGRQTGLGSVAHTVRVRSLHAQNHRAERAGRGQRCALALAGVDKEAIQRGQWLCTPSVAIGSDRFDARLHLWHGESKPLRSGQPVHVHVGALDVMGTVAILDQEGLEPGASALAQIVLRQPIGVWWGDRVVLRDAAGSRTVAGGQVLDPWAPARYRRTPERLAALVAQEQRDPWERLRGAVGLAGQGLDAQRYAAAQAWSAPPALPESVALTLPAEGGTTMVLAPAVAEQVQQQAVAALEAYHQAHPEELGPDIARWRRLAAPRTAEGLWRALVRRWVDAGVVRLRGACVHRPEHGVQLSQTEERLSEKAGPLLAQAGFEGAWVRDLARDTRESEPLMRVTLARLAQQGRLHQVVKDLYYPVDTMNHLMVLAHGLAQDHGGDVTAAQFRDVTGLGRKRAIQILEYLDRVGVLRRLGDLHRLRADSALLALALEARSGSC